MTGDSLFCCQLYEIRSRGYSSVRFIDTVYSNAMLAVLSLVKSGYAWCMLVLVMNTPHFLSSAGGSVAADAASFITTTNIHHSTDVRRHHRRSSLHHKFPPKAVIPIQNNNNRDYSTSCSTTILFLSQPSRIENNNNDNNAGIVDTVDIETPMGLILQENDNANDGSSDDDEGPGVFIFQISPQSNAMPFSKCGQLCCGDSIIAINGIDCSTKSFEQVMELMQQQQVSASTTVALTVSRSKDIRKVLFPNGICVGAIPGTHLCNLAMDAQYLQIPYQCKNGTCGTCEQHAKIKTTQQHQHQGGDEVTVSTKYRSIRPCVDVVPKNCDTIQIIKPSG